MRAELLDKATPQFVAKRNPLAGQERARRGGAKLYNRECAGCHGQRGEGFGHAPPLNQPRVQSAPPGALFWILRNGSLKSGMPSFAHLPDIQRWQIVTYLQSLPLSH